MTRIFKPQSLGLLKKVERRPDGTLLIVTVTGLFDLAASDADRFETEQSMWAMTSEVMPKGRVLDICMPKPTAEILVGGYAAAPRGETAERLLLEWRIGDVHKRLLVTGDRWWQATGGSYVPTAPIPFAKMPLTPERAYGGSGNAVNPDGIGANAVTVTLSGTPAPLPNLEVPELAIRAIADVPPTAEFGPMSLEDPRRLKFAGTYDKHWLNTLAPGLASDLDPRLFLFAPEDQRLAGFLTPGEPFALRNFSADHEIISGRLPQFRVRAFAGRGDGMTELGMRIDTLWLFAGARRGVLLYRGALKVEDIEAADVTDIMIAYEPLSAEPRPFEHYVEVRALRSDPKNAMRYAFADYQLAPPIRPEVAAERLARKQQALAKQKAARAASMHWIAERQFDKLDLPAALRPEMTFDADTGTDDILLPLPEELESGEFDVGEMLDGMQALTLKLQTELEAAAEAAKAKMAAAEAFASGTADAAAIDRLLVDLGAGDQATALDEALAAFKLPEIPEEAAPGVADTAGAAVDTARNWRQALLATGNTSVDEPEQFSMARARFLGLPEGRPLQPVRRAMTVPTLDSFPTLEIPAEADGKMAPSAAGPSLEAIIGNIAGEPLLPADERDKLAASLEAANSKIAEAFPKLQAGDRSPLEALLDLVAAAPGPGYSSPQQALADVQSRLDTTLGEANAGLDAAEAQLSDGMAAARLATPVPLKPDKPLTQAVARQLGRVVFEHFGTGADLRGRDLAGADLSGLDLSGADFTGAFLEGARLDGARLSGAVFVRAALTGASLRGADFSHADLTEANLARIDATEARFISARLVKTALMEARCAGAVFDGAEISNLQCIKLAAAGASFNGCRIAESIIMAADLARTSWRGAALSRLQLLDVDLAEADFDHASFERTAFLKARAAGSRWSDASIDQLHFIGEIDLTGASFARAVGERLTFIDARLDGADFTRARIATLCFVKSSLPRASFRAAAIRRATLSRNDFQAADFVAADLFEAMLGRADFSGATFRGANLFGADILDARLAAADFSGANLTRTMLAVMRDVD
ncbi:MAG: DUF2169 domain-containing protein [Ancalomicrobiaceae bacterium]|nr:DUF2169 domain-containing protein [Ancalomicrobiaceae bacterium]